MSGATRAIDGGARRGHRPVNGAVMPATVADVMVATLKASGVSAHPIRTMCRRTSRANLDYRERRARRGHRNGA